MVSGFCCEFFQIPSSSFCKKQKEVKNEEKNIDGPQKAKVNVNIDCYSLIKGQRKVREKSEIFNFLVHEWQPCYYFYYYYYHYYIVGDKLFQC